MANDDEILEVVKQKIKKYNIKNGDMSIISDKIKDQLLQIESYIHKFLLKQKDLMEEIKTYSKLSLINVVEESGVPRSTVYYNKDTLKIYIEERVKEVDEEDILLLNNMGKLQEKYDELKTYLDNFQTILVEEQFYEMQIRELEKELANLNQINETLILDRNKYINENQKLNFELKKIINSNIVHFEERKNG